MEQLDLKILDREYRFAVGPEEKPRLIEAAALVDQTMRKVREENRLTHLDRIAVSAALMLAEELLTARQSAGGPATENASRRLRALNQSLEEEIRRQEKLF